MDAHPAQPSAQTWETKKILATKSKNALLPNGGLSVDLVKAQRIAPNHIPQNVLHELIQMHRLSQPFEETMNTNRWA